MFKLVVLIDSLPAVEHSFDCSTLIVGCLDSKCADLRLPGDLEEGHLQIIHETKENTPKFFIANIAQDPFATLNGMPFGRQPLKSMDLIRLGSISLRFEEQKASSKNSLAEVATLLQRVQALKHLPSPPVQPSPPAHNEDEGKKNLNEKTKQEKLSSAPSTPSAPVPSAPASSEMSAPGAAKAPMTQGGSLKDDYLKEYEDDADKTLNKTIVDAKSFESLKDWPQLLRLFCMGTCILIIAMGLSYLWVRYQSAKEELQAARSVADISMALTYAHLKHIHPQNQNWSDPEFIKNTLTAVLAPGYHSLADVDSHGHLANAYTLRIYTSSDLAQFLVIAQPAPSLRQWLIPKDTLIVDSRSMQIRKLHDLKALNRLLISEGSAEEISQIIRQGELIALSSLPSTKELNGFSPPKALALIRPEAVNLLYNAPRYYLLGQQMITKALAFIDMPANQHERQLFQQELSTLATLSHLILYSDEGLQHALQAQKALSLLSNEEKFLVAYLQLNNKGKIANAHLLMDDTSDIVAMEKNNLHREADPIEHNTFQMEPNPLAQESQEKSLLLFDIEPSDPLFLRLKVLSTAREQLLMPISHEIAALLQHHAGYWQEEVQSKLQQALDTFAALDKSQIILIGHEIVALNSETTYMPFVRFLDFIKAAKLDLLWKAYMQIHHMKLIIPETAQDIEERLKQIANSQNWQELEQNIFQLSERLHLKNIPDEQRLIDYQRTAKNAVLQQLNDFLLAANPALSKDNFTHEDRQTLMRIMETSWITDLETYNFYLSEFDRQSGLIP